MEAFLRSREDIDATEWDEFVARSPQQTIYASSWYLDQVCPGWQAIIVEKGGQWQGVFPLNLQRKYGVSYSLMPPFTQFFGLMLRPDLKARSRVYHQCKLIQNKVLETLPESVRLFDQNFHPDMDYLLPFHWAGYTVTPRYTYWLPLAPGLDEVKRRLTDSIKSDLKLAAREGFVCEATDSVEELKRLLQEKKLIDEGEAAKLTRLWAEVAARKKGTVLHARDKAGKLLCVAAFLFDQRRMTYVLSASPPGPQRGSNSFLIFKALEKCYEIGGMEHFDFEGSMIEPVEHYFRAFNPEKRIYFRLQRNRLPLLHR
ncbi:MAG: hypothetical protein AAF570_24915, partial [Bacteroidota bacterium]